MTTTVYFSSTSNSSLYTCQQKFKIFRNSTRVNCHCHDCVHLLHSKMYKSVSKSNIMIHNLLSMSPILSNVANLLLLLIEFMNYGYFPF